MANVKSYTDLEQSKKLAEILPLESADCYWEYDDMQKFHRISWFEEGYDKDSQLRTNENNVCAWSLAALLNEIPHVKLESIERNGKQQWICYSFFDTFLHGKKILDWRDSDLCDNLVDACYDIILKLHN